jgi:glutamine synthetase
VNIDTLNEGIGFDGSSIRGFQEIQESDMLVVPDPTTAFRDPFTPATTLVLICNIRDPVTGQSYSRDARYIAQKAETYLRGTGRADTSYFGPEAEFFVFNDERGILSGSPDRQHAGSPHRNGADDGVARDCDRSPSP